ncbi:MAG: hypothetical protein HY608_04945 [Planctomycetes bacterium]|nr:hypothetical protein [Planctomycetota bacterium]
MALPAFLLILAGSALAQDPLATPDETPNALRTRSDALRGEIWILTGNRDAHTQAIAESEEAVAVLRGRIGERRALRDGLRHEATSTIETRGKWEAAAELLRQAALSRERRAAGLHERFLDEIELRRRAGTIPAPALALAPPEPVEPNTPAALALHAASLEAPEPSGAASEPTETDAAWERARRRTPPSPEERTPRPAREADSPDALSGSTEEQVRELDRIRAALQQEVTLLQRRRDDLAQIEGDLRALASATETAIGILRHEVQRGRRAARGAEREAAGSFMGFWIAEARRAAADTAFEAQRSILAADGDDRERDEPLRALFEGTAPCFAALKAASAPLPSRPEGAIGASLFTRPFAEARRALEAAFPDPEDAGRIAASLRREHESFDRQLREAGAPDEIAAWMRAAVHLSPRVRNGEEAE